MHEYALPLAPMESRTRGDPAAWTPERRTQMAALNADLFCLWLDHLCNRGWIQSAKIARAEQGPEYKWVVTLFPVRQKDKYERLRCLWTPAAATVDRTSTLLWTAGDENKIEQSRDLPRLYGVYCVEQFAIHVMHATCAPPLSVLSRDAYPTDWVPGEAYGRWDKPEARRGTQQELFDAE